MADSQQFSKFTLGMATTPPNMLAGLNRLQNKSNFGSRAQDLTLVNPDGKNASIRLTDNHINQASSQNVSQKLAKTQAVTLSLEEKHITNRMNLGFYDYIVNGHKMNPNLWEYSDMKSFTDQYNEIHAVGYFSVSGTILTPAWDHQLHRYVLIRRRCRMPLFSPKNNVPEILKTLNIEDATKVAYEYGTKQSSETAEEYYNRIGKLFDKNKYDNGSSSSSGTADKATNAIVEKGLKWAEMIANDADGIQHGYSQSDRNGPNYDCTSFISSGLIEGGLDINVCSTDFDDVLQQHGFKAIPFSDVGENGLKRGDILSNDHHVEWYYGDGKVVGAHSSDHTLADQISIEPYFDDNWETVLRLE